jgi:hypothetical protein
MIQSIHGANDMDKQPTGFIVLDGIEDSDMFLEIGDGVIWIYDHTDAMHPETLTLGIDSIPYFIKVLQSIIGE